MISSDMNSMLTLDSRVKDMSDSCCGACGGQDSMAKKETTEAPDETSKQEQKPEQQQDEK